MNKLSTRPPAERDLPPGRSAQLRAQVMEYADVPRRSVGLRLAPVAAATAVLAVAGGTALIVQDHKSGSAESPTTSTASRPVGVDDATLVRTCAPGGRVLVRFDDAIGTYAVIWQGSGREGGRTADCYASRSGSVGMGSIATGPIPPLEAGRKIARRGAVDSTVGRDSSGRDLGCVLAAPHKPITCSFAVEHDVFGLVASDVARVVVTWPGRPPVTAAISHGYFAARTVEHKVIAPANPTPHLVAYDKGGRLIGRG